MIEGMISSLASHDTGFMPNVLLRVEMEDGGINISNGLLTYNKNNLFPSLYTPLCISVLRDFS